MTVRLLTSPGTGRPRWPGARGIARRVLSVLLASVLVSGCALVGGDGKPDPKVRVEWVSLAAMPDINQNWPVPVELVRVRDESLIDILLRMKSDEWFGEAGDGFRLAHPDAVFDHWEVVPGTSIAAVEVKQRGRFGGVLFCDMREPALPIRVSRKDRRVHITVDDSGCTVSGSSRKAQESDPSEPAESDSQPEKPEEPEKKWWQFW